MRIAFAALLLTIPCSAAEPVPAGALQRLGTTRFRADGPLRHAFYSQDGTAIVGCTATSVIIWDAEGGARRKAISLAAEPEPLGEWNGDPLALPKLGQVTYDPSRDRLARFGQVGSGLELQVWDLKAGRKVFAEKDAPKWASLAWTPDGQLVQVYRPKVGTVAVIVRRADGSAASRWSITEDALSRRRIPRKEICAVDSTRLLMVGDDGRPALFELNTGRELRKLGEYSAENLPYRFAASRDGRRVAAAGRVRCDIFESATGELVQSIRGDEASPGHRAAFSPDGTMIYYSTTLGDGYGIAGGLCDRLFGEGHKAYLADISGDGRRILRFDGPVVYQLDAATGLAVPAPAGHRAKPHLVWMPDGKTLLGRAPDEGAWSVWNLESGRRERQFEEAATRGRGWYPRKPIALAADGRELVDMNGSHDGDSAIAYDTVTGKVSRDLFAEYRERHEPDNLHFQQHFAYESPRVLAYRGSGVGSLEFTWWNLATNRRAGGFELPVDERDCWRSIGPYIALFPDSPWDPQEEVPSRFAESVQLFRAADGRRYRTLEHPGRRAARIGGLSGNGILLTASVPAAHPDNLAAEAPAYRHLWEIISGEEIARWPAPTEAAAGALEPRGRYVVQATTPGRFAVYEPYALRRAVLEIDILSPVSSFWFAPDGRRLATVLQDTTIVIWETASWEAAVAEALAAARPADLTALIGPLSGPADRAAAAARRLAGAGDRAVALLEKAVAPAKSPDDGRIRKLIADLEAPKYAARERASKTLASLGPRAEVAARAALADRPGAELRERLEKLLAAGFTEDYDAETLRGLRAVRVLKEIDSPAAREVLAALAKGDAASPVTKAAK